MLVRRSITKLANLWDYIFVDVRNSNMFSCKSMLLGLFQLVKNKILKFTLFLGFLKTCVGINLGVGQKDELGLMVLLWEFFESRVHEVS